MLDSILCELAETQRLLRALLAESSDGDAPGPSHLAVLEALARRPRLTGAELARAARITPQAMNEVARRLEAYGEVARGPHAVDKRKIEYELTPTGRARIEASRAAQRRLEARLGGRWDEARQETLRAELAEVNRDLKAVLVPSGDEGPGVSATLDVERLTKTRT